MADTIGYVVALHRFLSHFLDTKIAISLKTFENIFCPKKWDIHLNGQTLVVHTHTHTHKQVEPAVQQDGWIRLRSDGVGYYLL